MESPEIVPQIRHLSQSPLHRFITGPQSDAPGGKSRFNPYRRRQGLAGALGLKGIIEELDKEDRALERDDVIVQRLPEP